jgi:hypothetical protein
VRLLRDAVIPPPRRDRAHRLHWSAWRRRHQHRTRQAPTLERLRRDNTMITTNYSRRIKGDGRQVAGGFPERPTGRG